MDEDFVLDVTAQELLTELAAQMPRGRQPGDITVSDYMATLHQTGCPLERSAATRRLEAFAVAGKLVEIPGGVMHQGKRMRAWRRAEG